jgi:hypothetical protein
LQKRIDLFIKGRGYYFAKNMNGRIIAIDKYCSGLVARLGDSVKYCLIVDIMFEMKVNPEAEKAFDERQLN